VAEVIWTEPALQELDSIAEYIAPDNVVAASVLVEEVFDKTERLESFQQPGRIPRLRFASLKSPVRSTLDVHDHHRESYD
jgi:toxin ParE1/3/4